MEKLSSFWGKAFAAGKSATSPDRQNQHSLPIRLARAAFRILRAQYVRNTFIRAFAPFWITTALCSAIACYDYHRRHAPLTILQAHVTVDGAEPEEGFELLVDGKASRLGDRITLGSKKIVLSTAYSDPVNTNHFVWYGPNILGSVDLHRRRVSLTVDAKPKPDQIELQGALGTFTSRDGSFRDLPAARYRATLSYGSLKDVHQLQITSRAESVIPMLGRVGAIALSSEPPDGRFELKNSQNLHSWTGEFPQTSGWLPAGEYQLAARRGEYQKGIRLVVNPNETNRTVVRFIYGAAEILSEPPEATVSVNNADQGQTPLTLTNMIPGKYQIRLVKDNYEPELLEMNVEEAGIAKVSRKLKNVRYARSMEAARSAIRVNNNILAFANLEAALVEQPNDPDATELMVKVQPAALRDNALALAEAGQFAEIAAVIDELEKLNPKAGTTEALKAQITQIKARKEQESADRLARQEKQRAETEILKRKQELEASFEFLHRDLSNANALPTATWTSTKSSEAVRAAIETMS